MKHIHIFAYLLLTTFFSLSAQIENELPLTYSKSQIVFISKTYRFADVDMPYRRAEINFKDGVSPFVIVYLHGGSAKGGDNSRQLDEPGVKKIAEYIRNKGLSAVFLVPQCPKRDPQGRMMDWVKMGSAVEFLIKSEMSSSDTNVYIFGGSMGGGGVWHMLSTYPELFTAAMICAGNPRRSNAINVARTPIYAVMGSEDRIMQPDKVNLQTFLDKVEAAGGEYKFDTEAGWSHEQTCRESYTSSRLEWIFSHK